MMDWKELLRCSVCLRCFDLVRLPVSLICGHNICVPCLTACSIHSPTSALNLESEASKFSSSSSVANRAVKTHDGYAARQVSCASSSRNTVDNCQKSDQSQEEEGKNLLFREKHMNGVVRSFQCPLDQMVHKVPLLELPVNRSMLNLLRLPSDFLSENSSGHGKSLTCYGNSGLSSEYVSSSCGSPCQTGSQRFQNPSKHPSPWTVSDPLNYLDCDFVFENTKITMLALHFAKMVVVYLWFFS